MVKKKQANAGCIVKRGDSILLVRRKLDNRWDIPAGKAIGNETPKETAAREAKEETGLSIRIDKLLAQIPDVDENDPYFHIYEGILEEDSNEIAASTDAEIAEVRFIPIESIQKGDVRFPGMLDLLIKLFNTLA